MPLWVWIVDSIGVLLLLVLLYGLSLVVRRRWITRNGGTFELSHRSVRRHRRVAQGRARLGSGARTLLRW